MPPAHDISARQETTGRIFTLSLDDANVPLVLTRKAQLEFELQGLEAMDNCLIMLTERLTPANAPNMRPQPLDLVGKMMLDSAHSGDMRKLMLCALWVGHHYPSLSGLNASGAIFSFTPHD